MCLIKQGPGKFEGETCVTVYADYYVMAGRGDAVGEWGNDNQKVLYAPHSRDSIEQVRDQGVDICHDCAVDILLGGTIYTWTDEQGFAYSYMAKTS